MAAKWREFYNVLAQLGTNVDAKAVDRARKKLDLDKPNEDGEVLLGIAAQEVRPDAVAYLIEKGAKLDRAGGRFEKAPPLVHVMTTPQGNARNKVKIVKMLLDAGADPSAQVTRPSHPRDEKGAFRKGTVLDYVAWQAASEHAIASDKRYDGSSRRDAKQQVDSYRETIPLVLAAGGEISDAARKQLANIGIGADAAAPKQTKLVAGWEKKVEKLLASSTKKRTKRDAAYEACTEYLAKPEAIASRAWAPFVEEIIESSPRFEDVAKEVYGEAVSFLDDEGWLCQGWSEYIVLDHVLELLAIQTTAANKKWTSLVEKTFAARRSGDDISTTVDDFFAQPWVKKHADYKKLRAAEKKTR